MKRIRSFTTVTLALPFLVTSYLSAQQYVITTFAGGSPPITPAAATSVDIGITGGVAVDAADNLYFSNQTSIYRVDPKGVLTRFAGNGRRGYSGDGGPAYDAQLTAPGAIAVDKAGTVYFIDGYRIRRVSAAGIISTIAGTGNYGTSGDGGPALAAQIGSTEGVAVDNAGNVYLVDYFAGVRRISANGIITTVAGGGSDPGDGEPATSAQLSAAEAIAFDPAGNLYIADSGNFRVRKVSANGIISTVAGNGTYGYSGDGGPATNAQINRPDAIAFDRAGNLYIADSYSFRLRRVTPAGIISTIYAGDTTPGTEGETIGLAIDSAGNAYMSDVYKYRIRRIAPDGSVSTAAGNGIYSFSGDGGPAFQAELFGPQAVALDSAGNVYIADTYNHRIRKVSPAGIINTIAGNGTYGVGGDGGPALQAQFENPWALAVDPAGNIYVADTGTSRVRRISPDGIISTIAGSDTGGYSGDGGPAIAAQLNGPRALAADSAGNVYVADSINAHIRKISASGIITSLPAGFSDPSGLAVDTSGNVYVHDSLGNGYGRVTKVSPQGVVTVLTGPTDIGAPPKTRQYDFPNSVAVDQAGNVYVTDSYNARIRKISAGGTIATIAGNGLSGYTGDNGPATAASFINPSGIAVDTAGRVYVTDIYENAVRLLQPASLNTTINAVTNGASNLSGPVAAGEIVVIYGSALGPNTTSVTFNGKPASILYSLYTQVAAVVPADVSGASVQVSVSSQGQAPATMTVPFAAAAPGLFTLSSTGQGQVSALNQDGSINSGVYPASADSLVTLFATGVSASAGVTVALGGQSLTPDSVSTMPGLAGLVQINVRIPAGMPAGSAVPVSIRAGGTASQSGVTLVIL